jgi:hypothetical protein
VLTAYPSKGGARECEEDEKEDEDFRRDEAGRAHQ